MSSTRDETIVWQPDSGQASGSQMHRFMRFVAKANKQEIVDYAQLYRWSIDSPEEFWRLLASFTGVKFSKEPDAVCVSSAEMPDTKWFVGASLNFAEHLLRGRHDQIVLVGDDELGRRAELTRGQLRSQVASLAAELRAIGVREGDRVAAMLPNCPAAVIAMLATTSIGAVFSSCSPDFGAAGVLDRFGQIEPVVLFACDGYSYAGKSFDCRAKVREVSGALPTLKQLIVVAFLQSEVDVEAIPGATDFDSLCMQAVEPEYTSLPFDHPLVILYSSGTTGKPKCIVHGAGGTLLQHLKELVLHTDISAHDTLFYFTTCGWMMWNWLVSGLAAGAKIVLYDGSPVYPDESRLWRLAAEEGISVFGTSPKFLSACEKASLQIGQDFKLTNLRTILSTGSPLMPQSYDYVADQFNKKVQLSSISGGTDIISCFALGNPLLPVYRGELQCIGLGMAVDVFGADGTTTSDLAGELVCTQPFPSMPLGFWNDPDGKRYREAYFSEFPGAWAHGDMAELTARGGLVIHGRSDAVLNPGGVRIGTAELYNPVLAIDEIQDCVAVAQRWQGDIRIVLFVVLSDDADCDAELAKRIRNAVRSSASPRHVPAKILTVTEIPRTRSGKVVELAVRAVVHNEPVANLDAIANPDVLHEFQGRPELL